MLLGLILLFPALWERLPLNALINRKSQALLGTGSIKKSVWGDVLMGVALGPVFSTCSPTYFVILATVLPASFALGLTYLLAYTMGLSIMLILIAVLGQRIVAKLGGAADSRGFIKRGMGVLIVLVGFAILTGYDKKLETALLDSGFFDVTSIEQRLLEQVPMPQGQQLDEGDDTASRVPQSPDEATMGMRAPEITGPSGFLNTDGRPITIGEFRDNKVVLVDFWTYSCINCQRTIPYLNEWYQKYHDQGLVIIGVHTPEFAFEGKKDNVAQAIARFGITYPVVLDNDYQTWRAFGNRYWPRKYLIDETGTIIYDHIGEGGYQETERAIQKALMHLGTLEQEKNTDAPTDVVSVDFSRVDSPETYFGAKRNTLLGNGVRGVTGLQNFMAPPMVPPNMLYLDGSWRIEDEYAETAGAGKVVYRFTAKNVYLVLSSEKPARLEVLLDGAPVAPQAAGEDVAGGLLEVHTERLYHVIQLKDYGTHTLELRSSAAGVRAYAFTFG